MRGSNCGSYITVLERFVQLLARLCKAVKYLLFSSGSELCGGGDARLDKCIREKGNLLGLLSDKSDTVLFHIQKEQ